MEEDASSTTNRWIQIENRSEAEKRKKIQLHIHFSSLQTEDCFSDSSLQEAEEQRAGGLMAPRRPDRQSDGFMTSAHRLPPPPSQMPHSSRDTLSFITPPPPSIAAHPP